MIVDVDSPFHYKFQLRRARRALDEKVAAYVASNPHKNYRELANEFSLSTGALSRIVKDCALNERRRDAGSRTVPLTEHNRRWRINYRATIAARNRKSNNP